MEKDEVVIELFEKWMKDLFPLNRSLASKGNYETIEYFQSIIPRIQLLRTPTDSKVFDWSIPKEWNVHEAWIENLNGEKIIDFKWNNLHLASYSKNFYGKVKLEDLKQHCFYNASNPSSIPYRTIYYEEGWGFCMTKEQFDLLEDSEYIVNISVEYLAGYIPSGELILSGETNRTYVCSSYICHPQMANNELSGPLVMLALARNLIAKNRLRNNYIFTWHSESIGALDFINRNNLKNNSNIKGVLNFTCMGGPDSSFTFLPSFTGNTQIDKIALKVLNDSRLNYKKALFQERGSDERQFNSPGLQIPTISIMKSMYGKYPEYHSSADNLEFISYTSMRESLDIMVEIICKLENLNCFRSRIIGEPFLTKHSLYTFAEQHKISFRDILNVFQMCNGDYDLDEISSFTNLENKQISIVLEKLEKLELIEKF